MKKRLFSALLAVMMFVTAIHFMPVVQVEATGGGKMNNQYSIYDADGRWDASQYYWNDGDYANIVADYYDGADNTADENFKTRHVSVFHDCDKQAIASNGLNLTNRSGSFVFNNRSANLINYYNGIGKSLEASNVKSLDPGYPPNTISGNGCEYINNSVSSGYAKFKSPKNDGSGGGDCRMIFRNFYNTDSTKYNYEGESTSSNTRKYSDAGEEGLNISQYDYLEFDLKILSGSGYKKSRTSAPQDGFRVHFYYETNCGTAHYLDSDSWNIDGYNQNRSAFNFGNQLNFDANGNYQDFDEWVTIRIPLDDSIRFPASGRAPTVKQITIRIVGGMSAEKEIFWIDDLRFVKNDDHEGVAYQAFNGYEAQEYPSGEYYMINDFEYESNTVEDGYGGRSDADSNKSGDAFWKGTNGVIRPFRGDGNHTTDATNSNYGKRYPDYQRVIRGEDANLDDTLQKTNSTFNWAYKSAPSGTTNCYSACEGYVTQGNYATVLKTQVGVFYHGNSGGWKIPTYYQRHYSSPMDLSRYTHFAIDVHLRYAIPDNKKGATGITFSIQLFQQYTITNGKVNNGTNDHDDYNFLNGYTIKFFIPYGKDCWDDSTKQDNSGGYGKVVPLSTYKPATAGYTSYGGMRLIFTIDDILKGNQTYYKYTGVSGYKQDVVRGVDYGAYCLDKIDGMRFVWMNRDSDSNHQYDTFGTGSCNVSTDIMLDNFIAYTPDTSVTIQNVTNSEDAAVDEGQYFVYNLYGGYSSNNSAYINGQLGSLSPNVNITGKYKGSDDYFTAGYNHTVAVPANGSVTITNLPFNSYYITQENWSWRYEVENVTCNKNDVLKYSQEAGNTATILPRVSLDGSNARHVSIVDLMRQRNFTVTFTQKRTETLYLDGNGAEVNTFN